MHDDAVADIIQQHAWSRLSEDSRPVDDLRRYFRRRYDGHGFSGAHFERLGGGGDHPAVAEYFTAVDLVAVSMLDVDVPASVSASLLGGPLGRTTSALLRQIPSHLALEHAGRAAVADDSPASRLWSLLKSQRGVGFVTAGKMLARKRPHLVPVYDRVVRCRLGSPARFWEPLRLSLERDQGALVDRLIEVRHDAGLGEDVSVIRVLDVLVWLGHRDDHRARRCA